MPGRGREMLRIAFASPPLSGSVDTAMSWVERFIAEAVEGGADITLAVGWRFVVISGWIRTLPTGAQYLENLRSQAPMPDSSSALRIAFSGISSVADFTYTNSATTRSSSQ